MAAIPQTWISPEDYLRREDETETKSEYVDGVEYAMSGGSPAHNLIVANVIGELRAGLRGGPCRAYASDLKVTAMSGRRYYYPDASVICGGPQLQEGTKTVVVNPTVLVEVLSPSTEFFDRGPKFLTYQTIPSLHEYVLISQDQTRVECFRRHGELWVYQRVESGELLLESVGVRLRLDEVYLETGLL